MTLFTRRSILRGLFAAPIVVTTPGLLMPVKALAVEPRLLGIYKGQALTWTPNTIYEAGDIVTFPAGYFQNGDPETVHLCTHVWPEHADEGGIPLQLFRKEFPA